MQTTITAPEKTKISVKDLNFYYGKFHALKGINLDIPENKVTAFIGPSGCGKSTLLRAFSTGCPHPPCCWTGTVASCSRMPGSCT